MARGLGIIDDSDPRPAAASSGVAITGSNANGSSSNSGGQKPQSRLAIVGNEQQQEAGAVVTAKPQSKANLFDISGNQSFHLK